MEECGCRMRLKAEGWRLKAEGWECRRMIIGTAENDVWKERSERAKRGRQRWGDGETGRRGETNEDAKDPFVISPFTVSSKRLSASAT
jgi:hypothetical protein